MEEKDIISSGILELYAMELTSEAEAAQVEALLAESDDARDELTRIEIGLENYAFAHAVQPSQSLKDSLLDKINPGVRLKSTSPVSGDGSDRSSAKMVTMSPAWKYVAAASVILLLGSVALNIFYYDKVEKTTTAYNQAQQELLAANESLSEMNQDMSVVTNKYSKAVSLDGLPAAPDAAAKVFWMKNTGEVYLDPSNLPEAPSGMQYQLWGMVDGLPVDAGMIAKDTSDKKFTIQKMKTFGKVQAFAITLETDGGNPTPKGEMYVMGKL